MEPDETLVDTIATKFILTAPKQILASFEQMMFLVEHAYWYYEDHVRGKDPHYKHYSKYSDFAEVLFRKCKLLAPYADHLDSILHRYRKFKQSVPVYGAILLDHDMARVLLVRGYKSASGWGFPRGKINQHETDMECAAREVQEETGLDIEAMLNANDFIEVTTDGKLHKLFIITGIDPETTIFAPQVVKEIGAYGWHYIQDLPATVDEANQVYLSSEGQRHRFFMVAPFVRRLREWIRNRKVELGLIPPGKGRRGDKGGYSNAVSKHSSFVEPAASNSHPAGGSVSHLAAGSVSHKGSAANSHMAAPAAARATVAPAWEAPLAALLLPAPPLTEAPSSGGNLNWKGFRFDRDAIMHCFPVQA